MSRMKPGPIPRRPPRRGATGPPLPPYLPMRYVKWEQYDDIWPNEEGTPYPRDNAEYPRPSPGWDSARDEQFYDWLCAKNVEPKWFHQKSRRKVKEELLSEFSRQWLEEGDYPKPKCRLWIKNYGGHRDMFYNPQAVNRPWEYTKYILVRFLLLLQILQKEEKTKNKPKHILQEDDPLGFIGKWVSTRYEMGAGDFRYGSRFYIKTFNKRKQSYTAHCPPMRRNDIKLSVQTLLDFEAHLNEDEDKPKNSDQQMDSIEDLFDGYEDVEIKEI